MNFSQDGGQVRISNIGDLGEKKEDVIALVRFAASQGITALEIDLSMTGDMNESGLETLQEIHDIVIKCNPVARKYILNPYPKVRRLIRSRQMNNLFKIQILSPQTA